MAVEEEVDWIEELTKKVIGAGLEVHRILGPGYAESVYEEALAKEFEIRHIPFERQKAIKLSYKGNHIGDFRLDFLIDKQLVVELKSVECLSMIHTAQTLSYLKAVDLRLGLLINFNVTRLKFGTKRVILSQLRK
jgi:GxxExxY protein